MKGPSSWIARHAAADPGRICLHFEDRVMTYGQVHEAVCSWAAWLREEYRLEPGGIVWIATRSQVHQRLLRWAVDMAGGVEAVVDPRLAPAEAEARAQRLPAAIRLDALPAEIVPPRASPQATTCEDTGGRILYSSGTSGRARAALFDDAGLTSAARSNIATRQLHGTDTLLCALPCFHAAGSLFEDSILFAGGALQLVAGGGPEALLDAIESGRSSVTSLAPTQLRQLARIGSGRPVWGNLRLVNYAGEAVDEATLRWLLTTFRGRVNRGYGTTEAGPLISVLGDEDHRTQLPDPHHLGCPALGVACRIDVRGGLRVKSGHLMLGYVDDPAATADRLVDGWLVTGDQADLVDGRLFLRGRTETAIRSGGEWVHPAEVEHALASIAGITEAAVVAVASATWGERPVAFAGFSKPLTAEAVRRHLEQRLAPFKWPDWIEQVDELPRTGTRKIDRAALVDRAAAGPSQGALVLRSAAPT